MKYYYKTPEQLQKEIQEHIRQHKVSPYNKTFLIMFLNILIIFVTFLILDKTGLLHDIYAIKSIKSITYEIQGNHLMLHFDVQRSIIITSKRSNDSQLFILEELRIYTIDDEYISIKLDIPKTVIDQEKNLLNVTLNQNLDQKKIKEIYLIINGKSIPLLKKI